MRGYREASGRSHEFAVEIVASLRKFGVETLSICGIRCFVKRDRQQEERDGE